MTSTPPTHPALVKLVELLAERAADEYFDAALNSQSKTCNTRSSSRHPARKTRRVRELTNDMAPYRIHVIDNLDELIVTIAEILPTPIGSADKPQVLQSADGRTRFIYFLSKA